MYIPAVHIYLKLNGQSPGDNETSTDPTYSAIATAVVVPDKSANPTAVAENLSVVVPPSTLGKQ